MSKRIYLLLSLLVPLTLMPSAAWSADALQVLPTRVVLSKASSGELTLVNKGTDAGTYRILLRNIRTDEFGRFSTVEKKEKGELFANKLVRFSPRRVTIEAGSFQKVRVMVRKPKTLPPGEYRTHMVFQTLPEQKTNVLDENAVEDVAVAVQPIIEISIPVIVRHGKLDASIEIAEPTIEEDALKFKLNRSGSRSIYGDVEVFVNSGPKKDTRVGLVRGLSVYYPNAYRNMEIPLTLPPEFKKGSDQLLIRYSEDPTSEGNLASSLVYPVK